MEPYRDPFRRELIRSRALGVLGAAALACVMLTALSLQTSEPPDTQPAPQAQPTESAPASLPAPEERTTAPVG